MLHCQKISSMKTVFKIYISVLILLIGFVDSVYSGPGDTVTVQTFTFGSEQNAKFLFPSDSLKFEKILMYYTLKCNPNQNPACGEWDYTTHTYLYDYTGEYDSTQQFQPSFVANGLSPDTFMYMNSPSWNYIKRWDKFIQYNNVISFDSSLIGSGNEVLALPFGASNTDAKVQYLWTANELLSAGLSAGDISGMQFDLSSLGSDMDRLTIRMKQSTLNVLNSSAYEKSGFDEVYSKNTSFSSMGWNTISFTEAFSWNGTSNVVVEISFDNTQSGNDNEVKGSNIGTGYAVYSDGSDHCLSFNGPDFVELPLNSLSAISDEVTISFWQYGDPLIQPQNDYAFEGYDANGYRVLNSHLPWSNGRVYWDAGNDGSSYDRIDKAAQTNEYEGTWNHWAFTKNTSNGQMRMYLNGNLWSLGSGKTRDMAGIRKFKIGSNVPGSNSYDGKLDEFQIWNKALDQTTISNWMYKDLDPSHPNYSNLLGYYQFNEGNGILASDNSSNTNDGSLFGLPQWSKISGLDLMRNFQETNFRPNIVFEQGVYNSTIDSVLVIDSMENAAVSLVLYENVLDPTIPTDTLYVWESYYNNYVFDLNGNTTDSSLVIPDSILYLQQLEYYDVFEVTERYELARYITPYGNGLDLGAGWTWLFDVSDYRPLLSDSVHLSAGNWQELLDLKFLMIEGVPSRDVLSVENLWKGNYYLSTIDSTLSDMTVQLNPAAEMYKLKTRASGHHWDNATNCAEFCYKIHGVDVDNTLIKSWQIMQACGMNPLYPQGGTWPIDRAGWCPGMEVTTQNIELTPYVTPGGLMDIDYDSDTDPFGYYILRTHLVSYTDPNFDLDAGMEAIVSPNNWEILNRYNPICGAPIVVVKNNGEVPLTSLEVKFGIKGGVMQSYSWSGNLNFLELDTIVLESSDPCWYISANSESNVFLVELIDPNGGTDEYEPNNRMSTMFDVPPQYESPIYLWWKTNNYPNESSYELVDDHGNIVYQSSTLTANTTYRDTFDLAPGCYRLIINDSDCDGLSWWANNDGSGYARIYKADGSNVQLKSFEPDFGCQIAHSFTIGLPIYTTSSSNATCGLPNGSASVLVSDPNAIYTFSWSNGSSSSTASNLSAGIYVVTVTDQSGCSKSEEVVVSDAGAPSIATLSVTNMSCNGICDGEVTVFLSGGTPPYFYDWDDPLSQTNSTATGLCSGAYNVTVMGSNVCKTFTSVEIIEPELLQIELYANDEILGCDGSIRANVKGGVLPYTYSWDDNSSQTTYIATELCGGDYNVTITDDNGCSVNGFANVVLGKMELSDRFVFNAYPNPAEDILNIAVGFLKDVQVEVQLYNLLGTKVYNKEVSLSGGSYEGSINLSSFKGGVYFLTLRSDNFIQTKKIIVQ